MKKFIAITIIVSLSCWFIIGTNRMRPSYARAEAELQRKVDDAAQVRLQEEIAIMRTLIK